MEKIDGAIKSLEISWIISQCTDNSFTDVLKKKLLKLGVNDECVEALYCAIMIAESNIDGTKKGAFYNIASIILTGGLSFLNGAYNLAFHLLGKAVECDPENVDYKISILQTFSDIPDFDMPIEKKREIADQILLIDPLNMVALKHIK